MARKSARFAIIACACIVAGVAAAQQHASTPPNEAQHYHLNVLASSSAFTSINHNDAKAAITTWFDLMAKRRGFLVDSTVDILDNVREIRERLEAHSAELLILTTADYLELESSHLAIPVLTHALTTQGAAPYSYLLLVNPSSPATTVAGLRGKNILMFSRGGATTASVWMEVMLAKENMGRVASFFASARVLEKGQECILSLYFGKADACVVDEVNFNMAKEMNPQLGQLRVLARSRPMIGSVIATSVEPFPGRIDVIDAILALHTDPHGYQLLQLFKTERVVRIQPGDLDSARALYSEYHRLPASASISPKGSAPQPALTK